MTIVTTTAEIKPTGKHEGWKDLYDGRFIEDICTGEDAMVVNIDTGEDFMVHMNYKIENVYNLVLTYECSCGQPDCIHAAVMHSAYMRAARAENAWMRKHER